MCRVVENMGRGLTFNAQARLSSLTLVLLPLKELATRTGTNS